MEPGSFSDLAGVIMHGPRSGEMPWILDFWWINVQLKLAMWEKRKEDQEKKDNLDQESTRQGVMMIEVTAPSDNPASSGSRTFKGEYI